MRLTLRQLQYFVAIIDAHSMAHAADALHVAPTALSLQVKALEEHFGNPLLRRHSRGVFPTPTGEALYTRAQEVLALVADIERDLMPGAAGPPQVVRLGVPPAIARTIGTEAFTGASRRIEGISLQVSDGWTPELMARLKRGELDFVAGYAVGDTEGISLTDVAEDRFVFAASPDRAGDRSPIPVAEVLASDLVFYGENSVGWTVTVDTAKTVGDAMRNSRQVESIDIWRSLLCRGLGTTITTRLAIIDECERGELTFREIDGPPILRRVVIACRPEIQTLPWAVSFRLFLRELLLNAQARVGGFWRVIPDAQPPASGGRVTSRGGMFASPIPRRDPDRGGR